MSKPDIVEIMPAIVTKKIKEFSSLVDVPVIAGGLVETEDEVRAALDAGATVVSTGERELWTLKV
jgi:glycerol uptake operon antiterminator